MAKHSKRNRRRMHQAGMGGGFRMVRQVPVRFQRRLPQAAPLSPEAQYRLRCLEHADRTSVREASRAFQVPVSTIYRWRRRFRPDDLTTLEPRSRRPHRTRRATWTAAQESAVLALRQQHPRMGKGPLRVLLAQQGHHLSASMIGRMLGSLRRRTLLREPHTVRVRRERPQRPYATRVPKDKRTPTEPGALVQLDTMHLRPCPASNAASSPPSTSSAAAPWPGSGRRPRRGPRRPFWTSSSPGCRCPSRPSRSTGAVSSWRGSRRPAGSGASPSTCCRRAPPSSTAGSSASTVPPGASSGSATRATSTYLRSKPPCAPGSTTTIRSDPTKPSGTKPPLPSFPPSRSHMYRTRTAC